MSRSDVALVLHGIGVVGSLGKMRRGALYSANRASYDDNKASYGANRAPYNDNNENLKPSSVVTRIFHSARTAVLSLKRFTMMFVTL